MADNQDHYNRAGMLAFVFSMVFVCVFFIYIVVGNKGIDLQENLQDPPTGEQLAAIVDVSKIAEPWLVSEDMIAHGQKLYMQNCALCHGNEGKGDGAAGGTLNPKPRNLITGGWKKGGGSIGIFTVLTEGLEGTSMAAYGHLKPVDRWAMTHYVNSITQDKPTEDPAQVAEFAKAAK